MTGSFSQRLPPPVRTVLGRYTRWPRRWWAQQSLRARLTLLATALFTLAVLTGAILLIFLQRYALTRVLDQSGTKTARDIAAQINGRAVPNVVGATVGGITTVQVLGPDDSVLSASQGGEFTTPLVDRKQLAYLRDGGTLDVDNSQAGLTNSPAGARFRVVARKAGDRTVVVFTDESRVDDSQRILTRAALIGGPLAVLLMATATYGVVALTLRPVAALRHGAADITAAGLAKQRLPVGSAQDEIHRLAVTLNAMLDRIDSATSRQRTFVGDAAHELRSPLASLRVQLEVSQRLGPAVDWKEVIDDVLVDADRLDRLVEDLLTLARLDESGHLRRHEVVDLAEVTNAVCAGYTTARVPVRAQTEPVIVDGDPDALRRVVINLVNNAVRYATTGVDVRVQAGQHQGHPTAELIVVDDGPGIPEGERHRVFDRFYRVQESRSRETGGTGLGLPIVRDIVRNHDGRVSLADRTDGAPGLRAVVTLPATTGSPAGAAAPAG